MHGNLAAGRRTSPKASVRPQLAGHWNWAEKLNNYLNILRIGKSSHLPLHPLQVSSDATDPKERCRREYEKGCMFQEHALRTKPATPKRRERRSLWTAGRCGRRCPAGHNSDRQSTDGACQDSNQNQKFRVLKDGSFMSHGRVSNFVRVHRFYPRSVRRRS